MYMCNYCKYTMPTFKEKSEVDDTRVKSRRDDDLGPKTGWNFRCKQMADACQSAPEPVCCALATVLAHPVTAVPADPAALSCLESECVDWSGPAKGRPWPRLLNCVCVDSFCLPSFWLAPLWAGWLCGGLSPAAMPAMHRARVCFSPYWGVIPRLLGKESLWTGRPSPHKIGR